MRFFIIYKLRIGACFVDDFLVRVYRVVSFSDQIREMRY